MAMLTYPTGLRCLESDLSLNLNPNRVDHNSVSVSSKGSDESAKFGMVFRCSKKP